MKHLIVLILVTVLLSGEGLCTPVAGNKAGADKQNTDKAAKPKEKTPLEITYVPSVFDDDFNTPKFGKDVFYPSTKRFVKKAEVPSTVTPIEKVASTILQSLVLKGISGNGRRRLALINTRTLSVGELWDYKLNGQTHRIRCEEIKPRSVVVSIDGIAERKEIQLRDGL